MPFPVCSAYSFSLFLSMPLPISFHHMFSFCFSPSFLPTLYIHLHLSFSPSSIYITPSFMPFRLLSLFFPSLFLSMPLPISYHHCSLNFFPSHVLILLLSIFPPYSLYTSPSLFFSIFYLHHTIFHALSFGQLILSHSSSLCLSQFLTITALNLLFSIFPPYSLYTSPSLFFSIFYLHHTIFHALSFCSAYSFSLFLSLPLPISYHHCSHFAFLHLSSLLSIYISISLFLHLLSTSHHLSCPFQFAQLILSHSSSLCLSQFLTITVLILLSSIFPLLFTSKSPTLLLLCSTSFYLSLHHLFSLFIIIIIFPSLSISVHSPPLTPTLPLSTDELVRPVRRS